VSGPAPGPWKRSDTIFPAVEDTTGKRVCMCHVHTRTTAEMEANCRLVAAAPEMAEALQMALGHLIRDDDPVSRQVKAEIQRVLVKATKGDSP
jgi:hypothetical protein